MKLKSYILVGYLVSTLLTILVVFWAIQRMLIEKSEVLLSGWNDLDCKFHWRCSEHLSFVACFFLL